MEKYYVQHEGKVLEADGKSFKHIMAVTLNPKDNYKSGVARCIVNREGNVEYKGFTDRSELYLITCDNPFSFKISERLNIKGEKEIIERLAREDGDFIGLEDPDIWIDKEKDLMHLYFTIPIKYKDKSKKTKIHLGHAVGNNLYDLQMTEPVLLDDGKISAKEVSIAPQNKNRMRLNLIESRDRQPYSTYSIIKVAIAKDMNGPWQYGDTVFHPKEGNLPWIGGHASPGPLISRDFIDVGEGKCLGFINGREANQKMSDGSIKYGIFSVGLFIYDYENGVIDWVSPEPFIRDNDARTITFSSQFVETTSGEGILYAHVDDSFVRAYTIKAEWLKNLLPK